MAKTVKTRKVSAKMMAAIARRKATADKHVGHRHAHVRTVNAPKNVW
jgi:hypothetical protein